jgi:hypothetical protein
MALIGARAVADSAVLRDHVDLASGADLPAGVTLRIA